MENAVLLFFEKEVSERCEQARQTGWQDGWQNGKQDGKQDGIYEIIYRNLRTKYGKNSVSEELRQQLDEITYYPALEDVLEAIWTTPSLDAFKRNITKIVQKYQNEIQEIKR